MVATVAAAVLVASAGAGERRWRRPSPSMVASVAVFPAQPAAVALVPSRPFRRKRRFWRHSAGIGCQISHGEALNQTRTA